MRGLFSNSQRAQCSIYETGVMSYNALKTSPLYQLEYFEVPEHPNVYNSYDFVVFNWHHATTPFWNSKVISKVRIPKFTIVTEMASRDPIPQTPRWFDGYLVLDPTHKDENNIWAMPRPLDAYDPVYTDNDVLTIGSFGFDTYGKRFDLLVREAAKAFTKVRIRINIPNATYVHHDVSKNQTAAAILEYKEKLQDTGVEVILTHDYMTKQETLDWCASNDLNAFYYLRDMNGLSAVTDQAISSQRPLLVNNCDTFRHIFLYMPPYPALSFEKALETGPIVKQMYEDWHPRQFSLKFEKILEQTL